MFFKYIPLALLAIIRLCLKVKFVHLAEWVGGFEVEGNGRIAEAEQLVLLFFSWLLTDSISSDWKSNIIYTYHHMH